MEARFGRRQTFCIVRFAAVAAAAAVLALAAFGACILFEEARDAAAEFVHGPHNSAAAVVRGGSAVAAAPTSRQTESFSSRRRDQLGPHERRELGAKQRAQRSAAAAAGGSFLPTAASGGVGACCGSTIGDGSTRLVGVLMISQHGEDKASPTLLPPVLDCSRGSEGRRRPAVGGQLLPAVPLSTPRRRRRRAQPGHHENDLLRFAVFTANASTPAVLVRLQPITWHEGEVTQPRGFAIAPSFSGMYVTSARTKTSRVVWVRAVTADRPPFSGGPGSFLCGKESLLPSSASPADRSAAALLLLRRRLLLTTSGRPAVSAVPVATGLSQRGGASWVSSWWWWSHRQQRRGRRAPFSGRADFSAGANTGRRRRSG